MLPRILSNAADAPFLGEAGILFNLTRLPGEGVSIKTGGSLPKFVIVFLALQFGIGLTLLISPILSLRRWQKEGDTKFVPLPAMQFGIWCSLMIASIVCLFYGRPLIALLLLICAQLFPRSKKRAVIA